MYIKDQRALGFFKKYNSPNTVFYHNDSESTGKDSESISTQFGKLCNTVGVCNSSQSDAYLDNFIRLRIFSETKSTESHYIPEGHNDYGDWGPHVTQEYSHYIELTDYGYDLIQTCV